MIRKVAVLATLVGLMVGYAAVGAETEVIRDGDILEIILTADQAADALHGVYITLKPEQTEAIKELTGIEVKVISTPAGYSVRLEGFSLKIPINYLK